MNFQRFDYVGFQSLSLALLAILNILCFTPFIGYSNIYKVASIVIILLTFSIQFVRNVLLRRMSMTHSEIKISISLFIACIFVVKIFSFIALKAFVAYALFIFIWPLLLVVISENIVIIRAYEQFRMMFAFVVLPAILLYPFIMFGSSAILLGSTESLHQLKDDFGWYYNNYGLAFVLIDKVRNAHVGSGEFFRMSALFDEAGVVGTIGALILAIDRYKLNKVNLIIGLAGALSFSLAFYIMSIIFFIMNFKSSSMKIRHVVQASAVLMIILFLYGANPVFQGYVQDNILERLTLENIISNNRSTADFDATFATFLFSDDIWLGASAYKADESFGTASWKNLIWDYGIIGTLCIVVFFITYARNKIRLNRLSTFPYWPFLTIFALSVYQRPHVFDITYILIFAAGIACQIKYYSPERGN